MPSPAVVRAQMAIARAVMSVPEPLAALAFFGRRSRTGDHVLEGRGQLLLLALNAASRRHPPARLRPERARIEFANMTALFDAPLREVGKVGGRAITGPRGPIPLRIYEPRGGGTARPVLVFFHGGGFVVGDLETHDRPCRVLCEDGGVVVVSVDYRRAPEHPFPAGVEDALAAFRWVVASAAELGCNPRRVGVGGDSAGGNLAAVVAQVARHDDPPPALQLLVYPATDLRRNTESHRALGEGYFLTTEIMDWFMGHYLPDPSAKLDPRASPLLCDDLRGVAPAFVTTGGFDPLHDEGLAYANRLHGAGALLGYACLGDAFHGFLSLSGVLAAGRRALADAAAVLRTSL